MSAEDEKTASKRLAEKAEAETDNGTSTENGNGTTKRRKTEGEGEEEVEEQDQKAEEVEVVEERNPDAGVLIVGGGINWDLIGRKEMPKAAKAPPKDVNIQNLMGPHVWKENIRVKVVASSCVACHSALITEDGKVYTWGRNDCGQLGHGDCETRYVPTLVNGLEGIEIVQIAMGRAHTLFLTDKGTIYGCGNNKMGQLGLGTEGANKEKPVKMSYSGKPIVKMACGAEFSMILDLAGTLMSFGSPEHGQLGHNTDGKSLERAGKVTFNCENTPRNITRFIEKNKGSITPISGVIVKDVKCGVNHTVILDTKGRIFTWGFGGYGRLGHAENKDEFVPRQVKQLENLRCLPTIIAAGSTFCLVYSSGNKMMYFWGQTKASGEATMYPKPVHDLNGWNVRSIACANKSIVIAADDSLISYGPSPTWGELMYGENGNRSSTVPEEVKPMIGIYAKDVSCGFAHTLVIARDLSEEERKKISSLPKWG